MLRVVTPDESALAKRFGAAVRRARKAMGWSQWGLAHQLGISVTHMGVIERGEGLGSVGLMLSASKLLGITFAEAIAGRPQQEGTGPDVVLLFRGISPELRPLAMAVLRDFAKMYGRYHPSTTTAAKAPRRAPRPSKKRT
jgi:transcriptional regulator with XRE-family HTH domain